MLNSLMRLRAFSVPLQQSFSRLAMGKKNFYAVRSGRTPGVYTTWEDCQAQIKGFSGAVFKAFSTRSEAEEFSRNGSYSSTARSTYSGDFPCGSRTGARGSKQRCNYSGRGRTSRCSEASSSAKNLPVVYSDGSCFGNGYAGATGGVGVYWGDDHPYNVSEKLQGKQTNQRAELVAACRALETALQQGHSEVELKTDSAYTIKSVNDWIPKWKANGWQTSQQEPVKNKEDIQRLDRLCHQVKVKWTHVRGHRGIPGNEAADLLARTGSGK